MKATVLDALAAGFETTVLRDAIAAVDVEPGDGGARSRRWSPRARTLARADGAGRTRTSV